MAAIGYLSFITWPYHPGPVSAGLDESWKWGLNALAAGNAVFGRDVVFTYGPLGFLAHPRALGENLAWAAGFSVALQLLMALALAVLARRAKHRIGIICCLAGLLLAGACGMWEEYHYRIVLGLCLLAGAAESRFAVPLCAAAGCLACVLAAVKFNLAVSVIPMLAVAALFYRGSRFLALLGGCLLGMLWLLFGLFQGAGNLARWAGLSWEIARGYGEAMSVAGAPREELTGLLLAGVFLCVLPAARPLALFAIPVLLALKHAFVGHPMMATGYFPFVAAVASLGWLLAETRRQVAAVGLIWTVALAAMLYQAAFWPSTAPPAGRFLRGPDLHPATESSLDEQRLPQHWTAALAGGVDSVPWELSFIPANHLQWRPSLVLQQYSAYTHALDLALASDWQSSQGPDALLVGFGGVLGRSFYLDTPESFRALLAGFEVMEADFSRELLCLRRRRTPLQEKLVPLEPFRFAWGEWVSPPRRPGKLYARLFFERTPAGRLRQLFWKTGPVELEAEYGSGRRTRFRILPASAPGGLLIDPLPAGFQDLYDLFQGAGYDRVARFRITGPEGFGPVIQGEWLHDPAPLAGNGNSPAGPEIAAGAPVAWTGQTATLTVRARHQNGYRNLGFVQAIVHEDLNGERSCYVSFEVTRQVLWLIADRGSGSAGQARPGAPEILENGQCAVNVFDSSVRLEGTEVALTLQLAMKERAVPPQKVFATAIDTGGRSSGWKQLGEWNPSRGLWWWRPWDLPPVAPALSVDAERTGEERFLLHVKLADMGGAEEIQWAQVLVNDAQTGVAGCYLHFENGPGTLALLDDRGERDVGWMRAGEARTLSNSFCEVGGLAIERGPHTVRLEIPLKLRAPMAAKRAIHATARDRRGPVRSWGHYGVLH